MKKKASSTMNQMELLLETHLTKRYNTAPIRTGSDGVIYTRVSSQEQAENNSSLEIQKKLCNEYSNKHGIRIKEYFGGTYESAKTDGRKEFIRMLNYVKKDKSISYIIVYNYDRFSRTGAAAAQLSEELRKKGIIVKSVTQEIDSSTPSGKLQEDFFHLFNRFDNDQRSIRTSVNTREIMLKGYWPYLTPIGYLNLKRKHKACEHQYIITEKGKLIKKAFELKSEGKFNNRDIIEKLDAQGLHLNEKYFAWIMSNPFYAGYVTGNLVKGKLIKGKHPPLVSLEIFLKVNELIKHNPWTGIPKKHKQEQLPLKIFSKEDVGGTPFTGYTTKGIWYYKNKGNNNPVNINAEHLNRKFVSFLAQFEYQKKYEIQLRKAIEDKLRKRLSTNAVEMTRLKKNLTERKKMLERVQERYALGEIEKEIFEKYSKKYVGEIEIIEQELRVQTFDSSNLENAVQKGLEIAENISQVWVSSDFDNKRRLQYLVFPNGILYSKKKDTVRTDSVNSVFAEIPLQKRVLEDNKKANPSKNSLNSDYVPRTGIESA